MEVDFGIVI